MEEKPQFSEWEIKVKRTVKDSVFTDLFRNKSNLLKLYQALHPEDTEVTEDSLTHVTIVNVLTDNLYNDLGFLVGERLIILVEAQSTWTVNILIRIVIYLAKTYHEYFRDAKRSLYEGKKVKIPKPELYVIYTGERGNKPDTISLSEEFFGGEESAVEVKAKIIYEGETDNIINQYIIFCKVYTEQVKRYGLTREAVVETIRICKDRNVLREYLASREKEAVTLMMSIFSQEEAVDMYVASKCREAAEQATKEAEKKSAIELKKAK